MSQTNNTVSPIGSDALVLPLRVLDLDSPFLFGVVRDMTEKERLEARRHGRFDNPPMSVLGITTEGLAAVEGKELAQMFAAAPELLKALKAALPLIDDAVDNMDEQCQAHRDDKKKFERRLNAMESLKMQAAWTREVIAKASGQNAEVSHGDRERQPNTHSTHAINPKTQQQGGSPLG